MDLVRDEEILCPGCHEVVAIYQKTLKLIFHAKEIERGTQYRCPACAACYYAAAPLRFYTKDGWKVAC